jgi:hypothetical protein
MDIKLIVAIIALTGVVASALIQYYLGRESEKNKKTLEIRSQAYLDFLNIMSELASSAKHKKERDLEQLKKLTQAKSRIVLIGSNNVVKEVRNFFNKFNGTLSSDESLDAFSRIVSAMRSDLSDERSLANNILFDALFGKNEYPLNLFPKPD